MIPCAGWSVDSGWNDKVPIWEANGPSNCVDSWRVCLYMLYKLGTNLGHC